MPYIKDELIKNRKEKINKTNTRQDKNKIPFSLKQAFSVKKRNKESCSKYFDSSTKMKNDLMIKPHLGRKRKNDNSFSEHNKFSKDNIRRKIKFLVLNYTLEFLNEKIRIAYKGNIGKGINKKELISLDQTTKIDSTIENNKNFIYKTLGDIFSRNISTKYTNYLPNYNNNLIKKLLAEKDEKKREYFKQLFNITFLQCVKWFAGDDSCKELKGFKKFCEIKNKLNDEKKYIDILESYLRRFEENIKKRIGKRGRPKINEKATEGATFGEYPTTQSVGLKSTVNNENNPKINESTGYNSVEGEYKSTTSAGLKSTMNKPEENKDMKSSVGYNSMEGEYASTSENKPKVN